MLISVFFWLCWVFVAAQAFPSCDDQCFSCGACASHYSGFLCCGAQASVVGLCFAAYGIFPDWTLSCIGRQILYHWATREALCLFLLLPFDLILFYTWSFFFIAWNSYLKRVLGGKWIRIRLSMQGTWVQSLVQEDATEQLSPSATTTEPECCNYWSPCA